MTQQEFEGRAHTTVGPEDQPKGGNMNAATKQERPARLAPYKPPERPAESLEKRLARLIFLWADQNQLWNQTSKCGNK